ncbi:MAG: hypothetical protein ACK5KQ_05975 [Anaerorhabdus sp.]
MIYIICSISFLISCIWIYNKDEVTGIKEGLFSLIVEDDFYNMVYRLSDKSYKKILFERKVITIIFALFSFLIAYPNNNIVLIVCCCSFLGFKIYYYIIKKRYKRAINIAKSEFPFYLSRLCVLIQIKPIINALSDSIVDAPSVFKKDLIILVNDIHNGNKKGVKPYIDFSNKFSNIPDCARIFRSLYALSTSISKKGKNILILNKISNEKLIIERKNRLEKFLDVQAMLPWILFLWVGLLLISMFSLVSLEGLM